MVLDPFYANGGEGVVPTHKRFSSITLDPGDFRSWESTGTLLALFTGPLEWMLQFQN